jgi:hypothetical protein
VLSIVAALDLLAAAVVQDVWLAEGSEPVLHTNHLTLAPVLSDRLAQNRSRLPHERAKIQQKLSRRSVLRPVWLLCPAPGAKAGFLFA